MNKLYLYKKIKKAIFPMRSLSKKQLLILLGIAFLVRLLLFFTALSKGTDSFFLFDTFRYLNIGTHWMEEGIYADHLTEPVFESIYVTPGAPFLFYILRSMGGFEAIILFQIICQLCICLLLLKTLQRLIPATYSRIIFAAGLLYAFDIPSLVLGNVIMTETVFTLFLFSFVYLLLLYFDTRRFLFLCCASVCLGTAALFRPIIIYFPFFLIIIFIVIAYQNKTAFFRPLLVVLLPFYLITGSWAMYNYKIHGHFFYSYIGEFNLFYFQAASIYAENYGVTITVAREKLYQEVEESFDESEYTRVDQVVFCQRAGKIARKVIFSHPALFLKNMARANIHLFFRPMRDYLKITLGSHELFHTRSKQHSNFILFTTYWQIIFNVLIFALLVPGLFYCYQNHRNFFYVAAGLLLYFIMVCSGPEIDARFRVPLVPLLLVLSAAGVPVIIKKLPGIIAKLR